MEKLNEYFELTKVGFITRLGERCFVAGDRGYYCTYTKNGVLLAGIVLISQDEIRLFSTYGNLIKAVQKEEVFEATAEKV